MEESKAAESLIEMNRISEDKENNKDKRQDADTTKQRIQKRQEQSPKTAGVLLQKIAQQLLSGDSAKAMELLHHCGVDAMMVDVMKKRGGEKFEVRIPVFGLCACPLCCCIRLSATGQGGHREVVWRAGGQSEENTRADGQGQGAEGQGEGQGEEEGTRP